MNFRIFTGNFFLALGIVELVRFNQIWASIFGLIFIGFGSFLLGMRDN